MGKSKFHRGDRVWFLWPSTGLVIFYSIFYVCMFIINTLTNTNNSLLD